MSYFYLRADFFEDANLNPLFFSNQFIVVESENFNTAFFIKSLAQSYIDSLDLRGAGRSGSNGVAGFSVTQLDNNGSTFDISNLYVSSEYKDVESKCLDTGDIIANAQLRYEFLYREAIFGDDASGFNVEANTTIGAVVNKAYHKMLPSGDGSSATMVSINIIDEEIAKVPTNNMYINYSNCIVVNFKISPEGQPTIVYNTNLIIIEDKNSDYLEDFSNKFYYDPGTQRYYLNSSLIECSLNMYDYFFPYILLVSSNAWASKEVFHGTVKLQLESQNDTTLEDISTEINFNYINICPSSTTVAGNNTIACTSDPGQVSINVAGVIKVFDDQQICPIEGTAKTVIAVFALKALELLTLYEDFSSVTTVKADVWGYNFRYIKYYDGTTYYNFKDNGSVASSTVSYIDETLDLSKYFSVKEISDGSTLSDSGTIVAITLRFKIYRVATTDADATDYSIDVPVEIKIPEIVSIEEDVEARQIIVKTNYATKLTYRFNQEKSVTVNITDSADGSNQETIISSSGKNGSFYCKAYNFYYDLGGVTRNLYITNESSLDLVRSIVIPSFSLVVKIGATSKTIYDENNATVTLNFTDLTQDQIANYKVYSDYITDNGVYTFQLTYNLSGSSFSSMFLRLGSDPTLHQLVSSGGVSSFKITKQNLFKLLNNDNQITISFLADGQTAFNFPFTFLNTSQANSPVCNAFSLSRIQLDYPKASTSFSLSYTYADEIEYSVIDQNDEVLSGPYIVKEKFADIEYYFTSGATRQRSFQINSFSIQSSVTTLRVRATVRNIISATANPQKAESTQTSSTIYYIPLKIGEAEVILYSDYPLSTTLEKITKGQDFWAFLQLKDEAGSVIPVGSYANYLAIGYKPQIFMLESADSNKDLDGVTSLRVDDYTFKFNIKDDDKFNDQNAVFQAQYQPIIDTEIQ